MDWDHAGRLASDIEIAVQGNEGLRVLWISVLTAAVRYAGCRQDWALIGLRERTDEAQALRVGLDSARTRAHNALIDALNVLSRAMAADGHSVLWRQVLGDADKAECRKDIGDFACYLACRSALSAR